MRWIWAWSVFSKTTYWCSCRTTRSPQPMNCDVRDDWFIRRHCGWRKILPKMCTACLWYTSIVAYGVFVGFIAFLRNEIKRFNGTYTVNNIRQLRADFGSYLLLGLEFLIASDILKTVVDPTLDELAILGGVVIVRTVLSVFLNKEIKELAEEENSKST